MQVVSTREFRSNQGRYLTAARKGQSVLLKSRYGSFKIVPVSEEDAIESGLTLGLSEVKAHLEGRLNLPNAREIVF